MKKSKNNVTILAIIIVLVIVGLSIYILGKDGDKIRSSNTSSQTAGSLVDTNSSDYKMYSELTGDDYDRRFIANMIAHHQGAIDMAKLAQSNAKHQELKDMAEDIILDQTKEISGMEDWQKQWGYLASSGEMMDHSAVGTMAHMGQMTTKLKGLSGDEFDKAFLSSMIEHHQSAINIAYPGFQNAKHEEVRNLTNVIANAQSIEIKQMKQWQKEWGY